MAAVDSSDKLEILVPLVAVGLDEYHQPSGVEKITLVRLEQPEKAQSLINVTLSGIVTLTRVLQL